VLRVALGVVDHQVVDVVLGQPPAGSASVGVGLSVPRILIDQREADHLARPLTGFDCPYIALLELVDRRIRVGVHKHLAVADPTTLQGLVNHGDGQDGAFVEQYASPVTPLDLVGRQIVCPHRLDHGIATEGPAVLFVDQVGPGIPSPPPHLRADGDVGLLAGAGDDCVDDGRVLLALLQHEPDKPRRERQRLAARHRAVGDYRLEVGVADCRDQLALWFTPDSGGQDAVPVLLSALGLPRGINAVLQSLGRPYESYRFVRISSLPEVGREECQRFGTAEAPVFEALIEG